MLPIILWVKFSGRLTEWFDDGRLRFEGAPGGSYLRTCLSLGNEQCPPSTSVGSTTSSLIGTTGYMKATDYWLKGFLASFIHIWNRINCHAEVTGCPIMCVHNPGIEGGEHPIFFWWFCFPKSAQVFKKGHQTFLKLKLNFHVPCKIRLARMPGFCSRLTRYS